MAEKWTDNLRDKMQDYHEPEPEGLWAAISDALESRSGLRPASRPRRRKIIGVVAALGAAAAVLLVVFIGRGSDQGRAPLPKDRVAQAGPVSDPSVAVETITAEAPAAESTNPTVSAEEVAIVPSPEQTDLLASSEQAPTDHSGILSDRETDRKTDRELAGEPAEGPTAAPASPATPAGEPAEAPTAAPAVSATPAVPTTPEVPTSEDSTVEVTTAEATTAEAPTSQKTEPNEFNDIDVLDADVPKAGRRRGAFRTSVLLANMPSTAANYGGFAGLANATLSMPDPSTPADGGYRDIPVKSAPFSLSPNTQTGSDKKASEALVRSSSPASSDAGTEVRHHLPIRVGVAFRYDFTKRWGVETGLTYSLLSSSIESSTGEYSYRTKQNLHYIGIPLQLSYDFLQLNWFSMYLTAGGMLEKCVDGRAVTDYLSSGNPLAQTTERINIRPLQWSVNAALGASFDITSLVGLYIEPGVGYFFNDGSTVATIYKDRPVNFNLELGLRLTFR